MGVLFGVFGVTIELAKESIEFFKQEAKSHNASYQAMIRNFVDAYAKQQQQKQSY